MQLYTFGTAKLQEGTGKVLEELIEFWALALVMNKYPFPFYTDIGLTSKLIWIFKGCNIESTITRCAKLIFLM